MSAHKIDSSEVDRIRNINRSFDRNIGCSRQVEKSINTLLDLSDDYFCRFLLPKKIDCEFLASANGPQITYSTFQVDRGAHYIFNFRCRQHVTADRRPTDDDDDDHNHGTECF